MTWRTMKHRLPALALAAVLAVTCSVPAAAIDDGVAPTYDEAYYATLDYYGNLLEGSMVKSYALNGKDALTDYGVYDEVVNLTDGTVPVTGEGETSFRFGGEAPDHFYFEGKTRRPFEELPWTLTLRYTLNGVPAKAEDLAGKTGVVEILLDIVPNETASEYARYNYTLEAMALFNQDDILSLEAPGAQVQLVGNLRTVLFLALPGEERHFTIRVGSDDFSFGGLTVLMVPATLAQLEEVAKLSERKDDLEEDYRALSGSIDGLLDALSDIQNGLYASAKGLDQLELARSTFSGGKGVLYDGADRLRGDLSGIAAQLDPVEERVRLLSQTVTESNTILNSLSGETVTLQGELADLEDALWALENGTGDLERVIDLATDLESSLLRLEHALGGSHVSPNKVSTNSRAMVDNVKKVHGIYAAAKDNDLGTFMAGMMMLNNMSQAEAVNKATAMGAALQAFQAQCEADALKFAMEHGAPPTAEELEAIKAAAAQQTAQSHPSLSQALEFTKQQEAVGQGSFQDFCGTVVKDPETAKKMNDLWLIYSSGTSTRNRAPSSTAAGTSGKTPPSGTPGTEPVKTPETGTQPSGAPGAETRPGETPGTEPSGTPEAGTQPSETPEQPSGTPDDGKQETSAGEGETGTPGTGEADGKGKAPASPKPDGSGEVPDTASEPSEEVPSTENQAAAPASETAEGTVGKAHMTARLVVNEDSPDGGDGGGNDGADNGNDGGNDGAGDSNGGGNDGADNGNGGGGNDGADNGNDGGGNDGAGNSNDGDSNDGGSNDGGSNAGDNNDSGADDSKDGNNSGGADDNKDDSNDDNKDGSNGAGDGQPSAPDTPGTPADPGKPPENTTVGGAVVDLITEGLDTASARIDQIQSELANTLNEIKAPTAVVMGDLADLCGSLDSLIPTLNDAEDLAAALRRSSGSLRAILSQANALQTVLNGYEPTLQEALTNAGSLSTAAAATIRDTEALLGDAESLARSTGKNLDEGTRQSLAGLSAALRQTARALAATDEVRSAKNTITDIIEDTWNDYTGDVNNLLLMDATAEPVSLTDTRNPAPTSIQVLIRTQEIKEEKAEKDEDAASAKAATTFWGRVGQMFRDFWNAITGIFR